MYINEEHLTVSKVPRITNRTRTHFSDTKVLPDSIAATKFLNVVNIASCFNL